jgi:50S ribosomal protein L16 3-hydroxylase
MQFNHFDIDVFLRDYWQKKPLLIKNPWKAWSNPLEADELAGLACEDDVEARLIKRKKKTWAVEHGPFAESRFAKLGKKPWTLLVQAVDHYVPEVAGLIDPFRFVPNWRIDDVMVSYATDGGGVGPHFDQYDVFLIQGLGKRRWQIGGPCDESSELLPHDDLRLLANFEATDEWTLEPGDILYVPPRVAHNGVAVGDDCMTYSVGFRAPARGELIAHWCDHLLAGQQEDDRYGDTGLSIQKNPGEISASAITTLHAMVTEKMQDADAFGRWFGQYNSTRKNPDVDWRPEVPVQMAELLELIGEGLSLRRNPGSRFSFIKQRAKAVSLFVDGETFECGKETAALAERLCAQDIVEIGSISKVSDAALTLILALLNQGSLTFDNAD